MSWTSWASSLIVTNIHAGICRQRTAARKSVRLPVSVGCEAGIPLGQPGTPCTQHLHRRRSNSSCCSRCLAGEPCWLLDCGGCEVRFAFAAGGVVAEDQEKGVPARVNVIAARRDPAPGNLSAIIDIASFFQ